ncbi:hypothetical protein BS50DRAFT_642934 [Corynespora cassiicola Philippines]|uniref:Uncharacterized protein n=1 Tax=Corynespora cassiicola Philippines TaxID=1448308 RepID=A0A2T2PB03_CORCC|nr:hypothetical protein BS50DRAFT_642934 [Corynespora cassiicola Philippines]
MQNDNRKTSNASRGGRGSRRASRQGSQARSSIGRKLSSSRRASISLSQLDDLGFNDDPQWNFDFNNEAEQNDETTGDVVPQDETLAIDGNWPDFSAYDTANIGDFGPEQLHQAANYDGSRKRSSMEDHPLAAIPMGDFPLAAIPNAENFVQGQRGSWNPPYYNQQLYWNAPPTPHGLQYYYPPPPDPFQTPFPYGRGSFGYAAPGQNVGFQRVVTPEYAPTDRGIYSQLPVATDSPMFVPESDHDYEENRSRKRVRREQNSEGDHDYNEDRPRKRNRHGDTRGVSSPKSFSAASRSNYSGRSRESSLTEGEKKLLRDNRRQGKRRSVVPQPLQPEKPRSDDDHPWVRTNTTTQGLTTRTSKINHYTPTYEVRGHPVGSWSSKHYDFDYTHWGELKERDMSAKQLQEFIAQYPKNHKTGAHLTLWIQLAPTDSARRYKSESHSKCRFTECPMRRAESGSIIHGHYRVALDERWHRDRYNADPFHCAGFVHLYCLERFMDFEQVIKHADVQVDTRSFSSEPRGKPAFSFSGKCELPIAEDFIEKVLRKELRAEDSLFKDYPVHKDYVAGKNPKLKPFKSTLTYHLTRTHNASRPPAQIRQFVERGLAATHLIVNEGDLEIYAKAKEVYKTERLMAKGKTPKGATNGAYMSNLEICTAAVQEAEKRLADVLNTTPVTRRKRTPKQSVPQEVSEVEPDDDHFSVASDNEIDDGFNTHIPPSNGSRTSERLKKRGRVYYGESETLVEPYSSARQDSNQNRHQKSRQGSRPRRLSFAPPMGYQRAQAYHPPGPPQLAYYDHVRLIQARSPYVPSANGQQNFPESQYMQAAEPLGQAPQSYYQIPSPGIQAPVRRSSSATSIGKFIDPELDGLDLEAILAYVDDEAQYNPELARRLSTISGILKLPSRNNSGGSDALRRVSLSFAPEAETREFHKEEPPNAVHRESDTTPSPRGQKRSRSIGSQHSSASSTATRQSKRIKLMQNKDDSIEIPQVAPASPNGSIAQRVRDERRKSGSSPRSRPGK